MTFRRQSFALGVTVVALAAAALAAGQQTPGRSQQPSRDTPAQRESDSATPKGRIAGRVLAADTARPMRRARVFINAPELGGGGRGMLTDEQGLFEFTELPAGRYTLNISKNGFVTLSYGQRRPLQAGTPLQLADGQQITGIELRLPRGSAIAGHIFDESGDPLPGASIRVLRYNYAQGARQLVPVGTAQSDDQGYYRVWGLDPGDYYVSATARNFERMGPFGALGGRGVRVPPPTAPAGPRGGAAGPSPADAEAVAYAPTFYPGVASASDARAVTVALSAEKLDIDFALMLVRTSRVAGRVLNPDGTPVTAGTVTLVPETGGFGGRGFAGNQGARIQWDGAFAVGNVAPGRYTLRARSDDSVLPQFAQLPLTVTDQDLDDLPIVLAEAARISGTVTLQMTQSPSAPDLTQLRIGAPAVEGLNVGPNGAARVDAAGAFTLDGLPAGLHTLRVQGLRGWVLRSVLVNGQESIDTPIALRSGETLSRVTLVLSDRLTEISGTIADTRGTPITEHTILAFTTDAALWRPQARQIMTARPDQNGTYRIRGLPPGEYFVVAIDPTEQGEWFEPAFLDEHRNGAARITLADGDVKTQNFTLAVQ